MKKIILLILVLCTLCGCSTTKLTKDEKNPVDFTVVEKSAVPEDFFNVIEDKKAESFTMSYTIDGYLYIAVGYGEQKSGGFSIQVEELYETKSNLGINTTLVGPRDGEAVNKRPTCPYIVVKTEYIDKNIVFE
jgi:hypothetical protein